MPSRTNAERILVEITLNNNPGSHRQLPAAGFPLGEYGWFTVYERRYSILLNTGSIVSPSPVLTLCRRSLVPIFSTSPRSLGSIFSRPPGSIFSRPPDLSFSLASRSQPATSPGLSYFPIVVEVEEALMAWEAGYRDVGWKLSPTCPFQTIQPYGARRRRLCLSGAKRPRGALETSCCVQLRAVDV